MYKPQQHDPVELERRSVAKAVRSAVRLHYSLLADEKINEVLAPILEEHARALAAGEQFTLSLDDALKALPTDVG